MIEAISNAETSVRLCTYLFETDEIGRKFVDALGASAARGVDVRVLVDAIGERYSSRPRASKMLRHREGVKVERFLPLTLSLRGLRVNLRNHRKLLIVDSELAFTGGMNIGRRHMVTASGGDQPTRDVQFRVTGPVVHAIEDSFFEDWYFASGDEPERDKTVSASETAGDAMCRVISDGPNEDFEVLTWILVGAMGVAKRRIRIMTPYFIPSRELLSALTAATLRGVEVDIVLPSNNNLPFVAWACQAMLDEVIHYGTRVYYQPPPFDHTKLLIVDDLYVLLGSANLDPRSLRLNFEFNLEVYDLALARQMTEHFEQVLAGSRQVTHEELAGRSAPIKIRDALAKLASPYL
jgi:cardiolipin synthase